MSDVFTALHALVFASHRHYCDVCAIYFDCFDWDCQPGPRHCPVCLDVREDRAYQNAVLLRLGDDNPAPSFKDDDK